MSLLKDIQDQFRMHDNALIKIILINVIVYALDCLIWVIAKFSSADAIFTSVLEFQALPSGFFDFLYKPWTLITYAFTHQAPSPFHVFFNMLGLFWFGGLIREFLGSRRLISLYVIGAVSGGILYLLAYNLVPYYMDKQSTLLIGASASVLATVVAAATLLPDYRFHLMFIGPVKIVYIAAFYVFMSAIGTVDWNAGGNIAHLGGALSGFIFIKLLRKGTDVGKPVMSFVDFTGNLFKKGRKVRMTFLNPSAPLDSNYVPDQHEIDLILDKISRSGYESLTKEEKQKLFKASQK